MRIAELMLIGAWSSMGLSFPWWMWVLAIFDICVRIADDHKEWLKEKQMGLIKENKALEEKKQALLDEIQKIQDKKIN